MDMVDLLVGRRGEGVGEEIAGVVVTEIHTRPMTAFTVVSLDTKQRYAIVHKTVYFAHLKPYYDQNEEYGMNHVPVWVNEKLAQRLKEERRFNE